ncbi:hypothetical protein PsYK624_063910 [Phanerochaete sordida]|uniref:Uncharacterized protein n=1 Tax=Phanerochaete sordida TaxID=48140 RepID=A0A9P3G6N3_9APHY|nr:hypothetical protein PsYK624_063910 [Phanerochaete sordida]
MYEAQFHGLVGILKQWLIPAMEGNERWPSRQWPEFPGKSTLDDVGWLSSLYKPPKPTLAALRRHTYRAWQATAATLDTATRPAPVVRAARRLAPHWAIHARRRVRGRRRGETHGVLEALRMCGLRVPRPQTAASRGGVQWLLALGVLQREVLEERLEAGRPPQCMSEKNQ